jgi:PAS domain S-box-containing protein
VESADALRKLSEYLDITLKSIGDAVISTDVQGRVVNMNPVASALTGWAQHEAAGTALAEIFQIINALTRQPLENPVERVLQTGSIIGLANHTVLISRDGKEHQLADSAAPIRDSSGDIRGVVLVFRDVTEEYNAIETIKRNRLELKAIYDNAPVMMCVLDGNRNVLYANNALTEFTGISEGSLNGGRACGVFGCIHARENPHGCGFSVSCAECSLSQAIDDTLRNGNEHRNIEQPLTLEVGGSVRKVVLLGATARLPASGQANVLLCLSDITRQAQAQQSLKESEERFRSLFENMAEGVALHEIMFDENGNPLDYRILDFNPAYERHTGMSPTRGAVASEAYGTIKPPYLEKYASVAHTGEVLHFETFFPPLNKHFSISAVSNGQGRFATVFEDITERKQTEKKLRASEAFSKGVLNSLTAHIAVLDEDGTILAVNDAWKRFALENGALEKSFLGENYLAVCARGAQLLKDASATEAMARIEEVIQGKLERCSLEYPCHSPEEDRWFSMNVTRFESDGVPYVVVAHESISQLKKTQEFLRLQEEFSRILLESVGEGIIACDSNMNLVLCNRTAREWFGDVTEKLPIEQWSEYFRLYEADGIQPLEGHQLPLVRAYNGHPVNQVSLTIKAGDQSPRYVLATGTEFHDEDGSQLGAVVILRDVTSLRVHVEELQNSVKEKEALLREIHHRVKNNLQVISSMISLESARIHNPSTQRTLQDLRNRLRSMALLHETIYGSESLAQVKMSIYLERLCRHLLFSLLPHPERIQLELYIDKISLDVSQALPCGLIINELLSNSLKHAFPDERKGSVRVELTKDEKDNSIRLQVSDTGVGLPSNFDPTKLQTLGIQLVSDLAGQLGGRLSVAGSPGAAFTVKFTPRTGFTSGESNYGQG